jgi:signal transduction histidine kinase
MSNQHVERAFQPFVSLWNETRSGIGLALCRHIMAQHHGDIALDSKPGEGATITLTLRRADGEKDPTRIPEYDLPRKE